MRLRWKVVIAAVILVFVFPQKARADTNEFVVRFKTENGASLLNYERLKFIGDFSKRERAWVVFHNLILGADSEFVPQGVELLGVSIVGRELIINVSERIKNYGGIYNEKHLRAQIVMTALQMEGIDYATLLIGGEPGFLPEGMSIYRVDASEELLD